MGVTSQKRVQKQDLPCARSFRSIPWLTYEHEGTKGCQTCGRPVTKHVPGLALLVQGLFVHLLGMWGAWCCDLELSVVRVCALEPG